VTGRSAAGPGAPLTGLSHVQLVVSDLEASARWYTAALGLEPYAADPRGGYVALEHRGSKVVIVLSTSPESAGDGVHDHRPPVVAPVGGRGTVDHVAFAVADGAALAAWAEHLRAAGVEHHGVVPELGNLSVHLRDPDGLAIELVAPGPR